MGKQGEKTPEDIRAKIKRIRKQGVTLQHLAERFGVSQPTISRIIREDENIDG